MRKGVDLPVIRLGNNIYACGGKLYTSGGFLGLGASSNAGQFMSKNNGALTAGAGLAGQVADSVLPANSIGGGAVNKAMSWGAAGMATGNPLIAGGAALAGAVVGGFQAKKAQDQADYQARIASMDKYGQMRGQADPYATGVYAANGAELPNINMFNTGGTHEQNPTGGIDQGVAPDGTPNKAEVGESRWKDYIFSDRLPIIGAKDYLLPSKYEGKTFAQASKLASKEIEFREHDPISIEGQKRVLNRLKIANDETRQMKEAAEGGMPQQPQQNMAAYGKQLKNVYKTGGYIFTDY